MDLLLGHLVLHLQDPNTTVLISGARERRHFGPMTTVDAQHLYTLNKHRFKFTDPAVSQWHQAKSGLTIISMVVNDYSHKPMKNALAREWF